jgi:hypothetical protein
LVAAPLVVEEEATLEGHSLFSPGQITQPLACRFWATADRSAQPRPQREDRACQLQDAGGVGHLRLEQ